jgi:Flp pilus assembly protein TadD
VLFAIGCYAIALFPALGFFNSQFLVLWQVSDHLQYLPLIAPLALAASCLAAIGGRQPETNTCHFEQKVIKATKIHPVLRFLRSLLYTSWSGAGGGPAFLCVTVILLAGLSILTFQRAAVFASGEKLTRDSIAKNPQDWYSRNELGTLLARRNDLPDALEQFQAAFRLQPDNAKVNSNLAHALALSGKTQEAEARYRASLALDPTSDDTRKNFADLLRREGRQREAILQYESGLAIKPDSTTRLNLAQLYYQEGEVDPAQREFREVLKHEPDNINALNNFAWLLATCGDDSQRNGSEAVQFAEKACALTQFKQARLTGTLAAAYAEAGRFAEAVDVGRKTVQLASESGDQQTAAMANQLLELYLSKRPFHQPVPQSRQP